jgi:NAD(P)-dependent dehydrogenase (short-subunit alcohol dehydrogenase family)
MEDLESVCSFATQYLCSYGRLDVLIHNAGAIHATYQASKEGFELTVAGQVVAPFLLTSLLLPALLAAGRSRVITVSSAGMYTQRFDPAILRMPAVGYQGVAAYAKAKRAQVMLSENWAKELAGTGVSFHAMHPGWVDTPGIAVALPGFYRVMRSLLRTPQQGADTIIWLATADPAQLGTGRFWHDRRPRSEYRLPWTRTAQPASTRGFWRHVRAASGIWDQ